MSGVAAAAIAAVALTRSGREVGGGGTDGGGGGGGGGGGSGWKGASRGNVTDVLRELLSDVTSAGTPAALVQAGSSTAPGSTSLVHLLNSASLAVTSAAANSSNETGDSSPPPSPYEPWAQVVIGIILGLLIIGTIIGNSLVCISVAIVRRLRTPSNLLIVSLAVADLLVAILVMPIGAAFQIYGAWRLSTTVCDMWTTTDVLLCTASILNLCVISVDRYFVITRPFQYAMKRTPKRMGIMIAIVWGTSAVVSIPPVFGWKSPNQPYQCYISLEIGYQIYATLCAFYLPLLIMIFVYVKIWLVSSKIAKAEARSKVGSFDKCVEFQVGRPSRDSSDSQYLPNGSLVSKNHHNGGTNGADADDASLEILPKSSSESDRLKRRRFTIKSLIPGHGRLLGSSSSSKERKATKTLGIIMGCFTLCWLPFFILALYKTFCRCEAPGWLDHILWWLGYANSFLNPVIYARFNREFRGPFKEILCWRCKGINTRMRSESYVEQYGAGPISRDAHYRDSLRPPIDCIVRYNSQGQTVVQIGNGSANSQSETRI